MVKMLTVKSERVSEPFVFNVQQQILQCDAFVHECGGMFSCVQAVCQPFSDMSAMEREARVDIGICCLIEC